MKRNDTHWDMCKKDFYDKVRERKDELQEVLDEAQRDNYIDFNLWYTQEHDWRFLRDILGERKKYGMPFDYCTLIHLPKLVWTDLKDPTKEHVTTLIGERRLSDFGILSGTNLKAGDNIKIEYSEADDGHNTPMYTISAVGGAADWKSYIDAQDLLVKDWVAKNYIEQLGNEAGSGEPYHIPYNLSSIKFEDNKLKVKADTITLDNKKTLKQYDFEVDLGTSGGKVDNVYVDGTSVLGTDKIARVDLTGKLDVPGKVPGTEQVYRLPYFFSTTPSSTKVTVTANTVTLDNKKQQETFSLDVESATKSLAGLMSSTDKTKLDGIDLTEYAKKTDLSTKADSFDVDGSTIEWKSSTDRTLVSKIPAAVRFKGKVDSTGSLPTTGQVEGDLYYVGTDAPYNIHIWNGSAWIAAGNSSIDISSKADKNNTILTGTGTFENLSTTGELKIDKNGTFKVDDNAIIEGVVRSLGNEAYSGQPYHIPYHMVLTPSADKVTATAYTITLDNTKSLNNYAFDLTKATDTTAGLMSAADKTKLDEVANNYISLLGDEAYSHGPYHFPYHMTLTPNADNITAEAYTITLDNNKTLTNYDFTLPAATTTSAGLMSSSDKTKLNGLAEQVQADWSETTTTSKAYIKNKPTPVSTISSSSTVTEFASAKAVYDYIQSLDGNDTSY